MKERALRAVLWSGSDILLRQGLQFAVTVALARLLSPDEFGTIALLYLFTGLATAFIDSGFSAALVQKQDVDHADESTVFWFNLAMGALLSLALWASAPAIAALYDKPILVPLTGAMALNVFLSSLGAIHGTLLVKGLNFQTQLKVGAIAATVSGALAIALAWRGYGVWALAAQTLAATGLSTLLLWVFNPWRPAMTFRLDSARRLFGFGGFMMASSLLDIGYNRLYSLLIGKFYGVRELGLYNRADSTKQLPVGVLTSILGRVAFPIFSAAASDKAQLRRGVRLALRGIMVVNVPMMLGMATVAGPLVQVLFGEKWLPAVPVMQVLCLGAVLWPLHVINLNVLMAMGHSRLFFRLEVIKKVLGVGFLVLGSMYGVMGIAWSQAVFSAIALGINAYYTKVYLDYGAREQVLDILPTLTASLLMAAGVRALLESSALSPPVALAVATTLGAGSYFALCWVARVSALRDAVGMLRNLTPFREGAPSRP